MNIENSVKELQDLHDELSSLREAEKVVQDKINALLDQLDTELNRDDSSSEQETLSDLSTVLQRFETEHPTLTDSINRIMVTLSNMGI